MEEVKIEQEETQEEKIPPVASRTVETHERLTLKESLELFKKVREELASAIDSFPAYSRISDCLYDAISDIDTAEAFFNQEAVIPMNIDKVEWEVLRGDDLLKGECPCCGNIIYSNDLYCRECGHKLSWR